jgi:UTP-glucose-1-phosphate uridylyltransferase
MEEREQRALGEHNQKIIARAIDYMANGDAEALGKLMVEAQQLFDFNVAPMCPEELTSPKLHEVLNDAVISRLAYGGKGVGSQGDGSVQFLAKDKECQQQIVDYLNSKGMKAYSLTIKPVHTVRKAIIPVAGFGTRLYPASRALRKDFFPIPDKDGIVKPVILILLEELMKSGIEEVCLVLGSEEERAKYKEFFETPLSEEHLRKLSPEMQEYENRILAIGKKLKYVYQKDKRGFGHAVYQAANFSNHEPVLLLLGDTLYRSDSNKPCALQMIESYEQYNKLMVSIHSIPLAEVSRYGILSGTWEDKDETVLDISQMNEKPKASYAEEFLGVKGKDGDKKYMSVFGLYIITPEVFEQLREDITNAEDLNGEIELTSALDKVREKYGMIGVQLQGRMYDMGNYSAYKNCVFKYSKNL